MLRNTEFTFLIVNLKLVASCPPASGLMPFTFLIVNLKPENQMQRFFI